MWRQSLFQVELLQFTWGRSKWKINNNKYNLLSLVLIGMVKWNILILIVLFAASAAFGQRSEVTKNYRNFDRKWVHFGFMLGFNTADFSTRYKGNLAEEEDLLSITNSRQPGFQLGIISSMKLGVPYIRLRFIPSLSFQERLLTYTYFDESFSTGFREYDERVESTNLDFPLLLKFRTMRYNNFAAYIISGAQYTLDLQSKEFATQAPANPFLKIKRDDFQGQIGVGFDFFLPYFKFGIELKMSHSFSDTMIHDGTFLARPIDQLYNRIWWFSFTFEG